MDAYEQKRSEAQRKLEKIIAEQMERDHMAHSDYEAKQNPYPGDAPAPAERHETACKRVAARREAAYRGDEMESFVRSDAVNALTEVDTYRDALDEELSALRRQMSALMAEYEAATVVRDALVAAMGTIDNAPRPASPPSREGVSW